MNSIKDGVQKVVNELYHKNGQIASSDLVKAAKPKTSPAHNGFEWDNKRAGNEYRLMQARQWIRRVEIIIEDQKERFVHVPRITGVDEEIEGLEGYYKPASVVVDDFDESKRALEQLNIKFNSARIAYEEFKEALNRKDQTHINFKKADRGFNMIESAINA